MTTLRDKPHAESELPPIVVIDARHLPLRKPNGPHNEEQLMVLFPKPTVAQASRHFFASCRMLVTAVSRGFFNYFRRINRGHIHRQRNI